MVERKAKPVVATFKFTIARQKGSHIILTKETAEGKTAVVVPNHDEVDRGTLLEIIRQAGLKKDEFIQLS